MSKWMVAAKKADFKAIAEEFDISLITARLLRNRGLEDFTSIREFLRGDIKDMCDPLLLPGVEEAAGCISNAVKENRFIRVVGDYDVDGICSTAVLVLGLKKTGVAVDYRIPHRIRDGYGINNSIVEEAFKDGVELIITCDNGIAAFDAVLKAKELGMEIIVTDHHEVPVDMDSGRQILPEASAVVDPKVMTDNAYTYPQTGICGAVVAMKLLQVLSRDITELKDSGLFNKIYELSALATVCDVMELNGENRFLVKYGMSRMKNSSLAGLRALIKVNGIYDKEISVHTIGFIIGPCLNASGRLDTAGRGVELLLSEDDEDAVSKADYLKELNEGRKQMTSRYLEEAVRLIEEKKLLNNKVLLVYLPGAHESVAGIVAGRLKELYSRPAIVFTDSENGVKGSGRSIEAYNMFLSLSKYKDMFSAFGGHPMAAGLSMSDSQKIDILSTRLNEACTLEDKDLENVLHLDMELPPEYISEELIDEWNALSPFGNGNPSPLFAARDIIIKSGCILGQNANVGRYTASDSKGKTYTLMLFGQLERWHDFLDKKYGIQTRKSLYDTKENPEKNIIVNIVYYPDINEFRGQKNIQLIMKDYK